MLYSVTEETYREREREREREEEERDGAGESEDIRTNKGKWFSITAAFIDSVIKEKSGNEYTENKEKENGKAEKRKSHGK